jgi:hypothetical protein
MGLNQCYIVSNLTCCQFHFLVVYQNSSRGPKRGGSGEVGVNTIIDSVQQEDPKRASPVRLERAYIHL